MFELLLLPFFAGLSLALISGPLGSFTVWRRMAYFGDTLAHSALMGVALALIFDVHAQLGILFSCILVAVLLATLQRNSKVSVDSLLGILSHSSLALGLILVSLAPDNKVDIYGYLFGDLLTVGLMEVVLIFTVAALGLALIIFFWRSLLMVCIDEELAQAEGKHIASMRLLIMLLLAVVIAVAMKIVGILLITAMLIIPAASSRRLAASPEAMAIGATLIGVFSVCGGLAISAFVDTPTGPSIVICASLFYILTYLPGFHRT